MKSVALGLIVFSDQIVLGGDIPGKSCSEKPLPGIESHEDPMEV